MTKFNAILKYIAKKLKADKLCLIDSKEAKFKLRVMQNVFMEIKKSFL